MAEILICSKCTFVNETEGDNCVMCGSEIRFNLEKVRKQRIDENKLLAYDLIPSSFFHHSSLFVNCKINNYEFIALIDTGAQLSIMDVTIAEKCELLDLIDEDYQIKVQGVGESRSVGKIYCQDVMVDDSAIPMPFLVMRNCVLSGCGVIIGMDILNTHRSVIDIFNKTISFSGKICKLQTNEKEES